MNTKYRPSASQNPSFCYIAPTEYISAYATSSKTHLLLAHLVDHDEKYAKLYKQLSDEGHYIMMDCSAYELKKPYAPDRLLELGVKCGADAIVLPDYPFEPAQKTIDAAEKFIPLFKAESFSTFFVPQAKRGDIGDWIRAYEYAANHPDIDIIGMSILGIPAALPHIDPSYARVVMTSILQHDDKFAYGKHHHFLGLNSGAALEVPSLLNMHALTTIDSSNPVWMAILGHEYSQNTDSMLSVRKCNFPVQFNYPYSKDPETHRRIAHNIKLTQSMFENTDGSRVWYAQE